MEQEALGWEPHQVKPVADTMMNLKAEIGVVLTSYILGCLVVGYYLVRWKKGLDVRRVGSGSVGATNVGRVLGPAGFAITFCGDMSKGMAAVLLARSLSMPEWTVLTCVLGVTTGHIFPLQLGFRGGKGVAAAVGAITILDWRLVVVLLAPFVLLLICTRRFVLSGLGAILLLPLATLLVRHSPRDALWLTAPTLLILWAHRQNLRSGGTPMQAVTPKEG